MIRFILLALTVILFLIFSIPFLFVYWIIGKFNMDLKDRLSLKLVKWAFRRCLDTTGVQITYLGEENVPKDVPVLYVGNHRSYFDILITYMRVPRPTGYVAKKEMQKIPLLSNWMRNIHCTFLDRENIREGLKTILLCVEKVRSGISICIFPEGTRNKTADTFLPFHDGSLKIAEKSGCPVVPITINNSNAIFEDQAPIVKKTHVIVEYGKAFYIKDLSPEEQRRVGAYTKGIIEETYLRNQELV